MEFKHNLGIFAMLCCTACTAFAQSNVVMYGVIDTSLARDDTGNATTLRMDSGVLNGSRLGFKGTEEIGNGLSAIFQIENGFLPDTGGQADTARLFNRMSFVGLTGAFGTVKMGRQINPVYATLTSWDPFAIGMAGDSTKLFSFNGSRTDNVLSYAYAARGLRTELQYAFGEAAGNNATNRTLAGLAGYKVGPFEVVGTYQDIRNATDTGSTKMALLGANYDFGVLKMYATYAAETGVTLGTAVKRDQRDALVGFNAPVGQHGILIASWIHKADRAVADADADQYAIGYKYLLSVRTALYTSIGRTNNDSRANYRVTVAGNSDKLFDVGIRHNF